MRRIDKARLGLQKGDTVVGPESVTITTTSATLEPATAITGGRNRLIARPIDGDIFWSWTSPATAAAGMKLAKGETMEWAGDDDVFAIAASSVDVRVIETREDD